MKRVFLGGSRRVCRLNDAIRKRLEEIVRREMEVVVGDANGADKALQRQLADWKYPDVVVYHVGARPRNNEGGWPTTRIATGSVVKGFEFYAAKDRAMASEAECGLMLWDGESRGTITNVENLVRAGKPVAVYVSPQRRFINVLTAADMEALRAPNVGVNTRTGGLSKPIQHSLDLPSRAGAPTLRHRRKTA